VRAYKAGTARYENGSFHCSFGPLMWGLLVSMLRG
jgi:hypothetical protein